MSSPRQEEAARPRITRSWADVALGILLTILLASLIFVAVVLLAKSNLLTPDDLTDEETKSLLTFLGVAFGVVATLIGALLANQHNRRTHMLAEQAKFREQQLALDTEERLKLDTVAKVLELVTTDNAYAPRARVAGAIATLMQLHGGVVSVRVLGELWEADAVSSSTAVWLIDRILRDDPPKEDETSEAAEVLSFHCARLTPSPDDKHQERFDWPSILLDTWPSAMSFSTRNALIAATTQVLLTRELNWWASGALRTPVLTLVNAMGDPDLGSCAALVLKKLNDRQALRTVRLDENDLARITEKANSAEPTAWFSSVLDKLDDWASEVDRKVSMTPNALGSSPLVTETPPPGQPGERTPAG
ncbi:hypothetical protein [Kibdelosporangium aridum]|uniref:hypothetical protein n=1 Tax=Kibdelosporangium aridum TaxID=2030 RepID=UPI000527E7DD